MGPVVSERGLKRRLLRSIQEFVVLPLENMRSGVIQAETSALRLLLLDVVLLQAGGELLVQGRAQNQIAGHLYRQQLSSVLVRH